MDNCINEIFIPDNEVKLPEELDYSRVDEYIRSAEAFSHSSYQSVEEIQADNHQNRLPDLHSYD